MIVNVILKIRKSGVGIFVLNDVVNLFECFN